MLSDRTQITRNFRAGEFKCYCDGEFCAGYPSDMNKVLVVAQHTQILRDLASAALGEEVWFDIGRGNSCLEYNNSIPGAKKNTSHHIYEIWPVGHGGEDVTPYIKARATSKYWLKNALAVMARVAYASGWRGIKTYPGHNHLDRRDVPWLENFDPVYRIPIKRSESV